MDPSANRAEQIRRAKEILRIVDECPDNGELRPEQERAILDQADRLAELVLALFEWRERR